MTQEEKQLTPKGCEDCWHNYHCPMPQEGYDFNPDTCPYNPDNKKRKLRHRKKKIQWKFLQLCLKKICMETQ